MPPINVTPQTSATAQPGYTLNSGPNSLAYYNDTAVSALAYKWATATPEERANWLGSTWVTAQFGSPDPTDGVDANGNVYTSPQTLLALTNYVQSGAGNNDPTFTSMFGPPPQPGPNEFIETPEQVANRIAQANADRAYDLALQQEARLSAASAQSAQIAQAQIAASAANAAAAAQASMYGADRALEGTKYASDNALAGSKYGTQGQLLGSVYGTNESSRLGAYSAGGNLALGQQGLWDARTDNLLSLRYNPSDIIAREYTSRAMLKPEGYEGPAYQNVPGLDQAIQQLLSWSPGMTYEQALSILNGGAAGTGAGTGGVPVPPSGAGTGGLGNGSGTGGTGGGTYQPRGENGQPLGGTAGVSPYAGMQFEVVAGPQAPTQEQLANSTWQNQTQPSYTGNPVNTTDQSNPWATTAPPPGGATDPAKTTYPPGVELFQAAHGGRALPSAIVGDPQRPGVPNEELVIDRHPEPGFDVIPLNKMSPASRMMAKQQPHLAEGTYDYNKPAEDGPPTSTRTYDSRDYDNRYYDTRTSSMIPYGEDNVAQPAPVTQPAPSTAAQPAASTTPTTPVPAVVDAGSATAPAPTGGGAGTAPIIPPSGAIGAAGPNGTITSYPDQVYQNLPTLQFLQGVMPASAYGNFQNGMTQGAFGMQVPNIGNMNLARISEIAKDPQAYGQLESIYKSANMDLGSLIARLMARAPRGNAFQPSMIET